MELVEFRDALLEQFRFAFSADNTSDKEEFINYVSEALVEAGPVCTCAKRRYFVLCAAKEFIHCKAVVSSAGTADFILAQRVFH